MFNDLSSPLSYLASRRSGRAREMVGPGPDEAELGAILALAARTPDHGKLAPWRFVVVGADQRDEFAALLARALGRMIPTPAPRIATRPTNSPATAKRWWCCSPRRSSRTRFRCGNRNCQSARRR